MPIVAEPAWRAPALALGAVSANASPSAALQVRPPLGPTTLQEPQQALAVREEDKVAARVADQRALVELQGLADRGEVPSPERARELVVSAIASAIASRDRNNGALPILISKVQEAAPETYGSLVLGMAHDGFFLTLMNLGADQTITNMALVLRGELIRELGLTTCSELMTLDLGLRHWVEGRVSLARAQRASKPGDYAKLTQVAQAADKLYEGVLQRLRVRHQPRAATLHVGHATTLAIQVNEGGPPAGGEANRTKHVPSRQVAEVPAARALPHYFDKTD